MVNVNEAKKLILDNCRKPKIECHSLLDANGFILAEQPVSLINTPPFDQSAMDGYAFSFDKWDGKKDLKVVGEVQAGTVFPEILKSFECVRIFTGASLPKGADTVIMQEKIIPSGDCITIKDETLIKGSNVRLKGSQTNAGEYLLKVEQILLPPAISYLAGAGVDKVKIYSNPVVSILVTGKELLKPGNPISEGKIYESNSFGLIAALSQINIIPSSVDFSDDNEEEIINKISEKLNSDIVIITGGVSVGSYDYVHTALEKCGVKKIFHKVRQKPGKPFFFGKKDDTIIFALPGNPAAVLSCFYGYIVPAVSYYTHKEYFKSFTLPLKEEYRKKSDLTYFLKGKIQNNEVKILEHQESFLMNSFAMADCIIELNHEKEFFQKGDPVNVTMIT